MWSDADAERKAVPRPKANKPDKLHQKRSAQLQGRRLNKGGRDVYLARRHKTTAPYDRRGAIG